MNDFSENKREFERFELTFPAAVETEGGGKKTANQNKGYKRWRGFPEDITAL